MASNTALSNTLESQILNLTLRGGALYKDVAAGTGFTYNAATGLTAYTVGTMPLYLAFLTNSTNDTSLVELASGGAYTTRPAFSGTVGQQFSNSTAADVPSSAGSNLVNRQALTFTASGAANNNIIGIAICTSATVNTTPSLMATDPTVLYYGDLTGGVISLAIGQSITFAAGAITVSIE